MYRWTLVSRNTGEAPSLMGITSDLEVAQRMAEPHLESGAAFLGHIEEVRCAMAASDLTSCYMSTGLYWIGRLGDSGRVFWAERYGAARWHGDRHASGWTHATSDFH
jgi:hypothetical protein